MRFFYLLFACALAVSACSVSEPDPPAPNKDVAGIKPEVKLEFLTRDGCKNTPVMLENLKAAIAAGKVRAELTVIEQGTLPSHDPRNGYPTPTILMNGRDIFGLGVPQPPFPEPS